MFKNYFLSWGMLLLAVLFNAAGVFIVKFKLNELGPIQLTSVKSVIQYMALMAKSPLVIFGAVIFFVAPLLFAVALSRMDIAVAYPVQIGLNFVVLLILAVLFLGEKLSFFKILGILFIMAAIACLHVAK